MLLVSICPKVIRSCSFRVCNPEYLAGGLQIHREQFVKDPKTFGQVSGYKEFSLSFFHLAQRRRVVSWRGFLSASASLRES
jgi:hypothetical protein